MNAQPEYEDVIAIAQGMPWPKVHQIEIEQ
jgi:uncharacterized protein (DUF111 family)